MDKYIKLLASILPLLKPNNDNKKRKVKKRKLRQLEKARKKYYKRFMEDGVVDGSEQKILDMLDDVILQLTLSIAK